MKNLTKCKILKTFSLKSNEKFADHNLEKLCPWSLASSIPVFDLERVCPRKVVPCSWSRIFRVLGLVGCVLDSTSGDHHNKIMVALLDNRVNNVVQWNVVHY